MVSVVPLDITDSLRGFKKMFKEEFLKTTRSSATSPMWREMFLPRVPRTKKRLKKVVANDDMRPIFYGPSREKMMDFLSSSAKNGKANFPHDSEICGEFSGCLPRLFSYLQTVDFAKDQKRH
jgi:hypothetical protein